MNELNNLTTSYDIEDFKQYFDEMEIDEEGKERRTELANELNDVLLFAIALIDIYIEQGIIYEQEQYLKDTVAQRYSSIILKYVGADDYLQTYATNYANSFIEATFDNLGTDYYLSDKRAFINACGGANDVFNYDDYYNALVEGKTHKQWLDIRDKRERKSHRKVGGKTLPITEPYKVGNSLMLFPHDTSNNVGVEELANCRCSIRYF